MNRKSLFLTRAAVACVSSVRAEPVSNVEDLVTALWDARGNSGKTIVLAKGSYDVSGQAMKTYNASKKIEGNSVSHISISRVTLKGETDDPRDTVIYGNGTNNVLYCYQGAVAGLTISNGCTGATAYGGGVSTLNDATALSNCVITCCHSTSYGGGVHNAKCIDCDICFNTSENSGAGAFRAHLIGCRIFGNESGKDGGGAHKTKVVGGCRVYGNTAKEGGGGVSNSDGGQVWTYDSTIVSNRAATGGGAYNMVLTNCTVACNTAKNGGGVAYKSEISDSWVTNNVATSGTGGGGGIYADSAGNAVTVKRCEIAGNFTAGKGGGTYFAIVEDSQIHDNFAGGADGGACYKGSIVGGAVSNNVSGASGSGLCGVTSVSNCNLYATPIDSVGELVNCRVCGYTNGWLLTEGANAVTNGHFAGQDMLTEGTFAARNTLFSNNRVTTVFNGYHTSGIAFESCTVAGNRFSNTFQNFGSTAYAPCWCVNSLFAGNKSLNGTTDYGATWGSSGQKLAFTNCLFASSTSSTNGLVYPPADCLFKAKPRFVMDGTADQYALKHNSPACGCGLVQDWMDEANDVRGEGFPRLRDGKVDVGCYQCWLDPLGLMLLLR